MTLYAGFAACTISGILLLFIGQPCTLLGLLLKSTLKDVVFSVILVFYSSGLLRDRGATSTAQQTCALTDRGEGFKEQHITGHHKSLRQGCNSPWPG